MRSPRQLLVAIAVAMVIVASQTFRYPPEYLFLPKFWAILAGIGGLVAGACALYPTRFLVAVSGSLLVTICSARALALSGELVAGGFRSTEIQAGFVIAAAIWLLVAVLLYVTWREYVVPWSIGAAPK